MFIWRKDMVWQEEAAKVVAATRELVCLGRVPNVIFPSAVVVETTA